MGSWILNNESIDNIIRCALEHGFLRIIPAINIDSLVSAGIISKNLYEHNVKAPINLDPKNIIDTDEPTLLIDLPSPRDKDYIKTITFKNENSVSAHITYYFDKTFGVSKWDKVLSILSGVYRGLDIGKEGFRGIEKEFLDELSRTNIIGVDLGFRLWGWKRQPLIKAFYRTLIPYIPGYSGDPSRVDAMLKNTLKLENVEDVMGEHIFTSSGKEKIKTFLQYLDNTIEYLNEDERKKLLLKLVGYVYQFNIKDKKPLDLIEVLGAINVFTSLKQENPLFVSLLSIDDTLIPQILVFYYDIIDEFCLEVSTIINQYLKGEKKTIEVEDTLKRPELFIDILKSIDKLPQNSVFYIRLNGELITSLSEYLRVKKEVEKTYTSCSEYQLCRVDEKGDLIKA